MKNAKAIELAKELIRMCEEEIVTCKRIYGEIEDSALPGWNGTFGNMLCQRIYTNQDQIKFFNTMIEHWKTLPENTAPDTFDNELETDF